MVEKNYDMDSIGMTLPLHAINSCSFLQFCSAGG